jgi:uncharacterized heparinase superfamily protein
MARDPGSPMKGTWRRRYRRLLDLPPGMLRGRILYGAKRPVFAGALYDRLLLGRREPSLRVIPADPWPADAARGREIATGSFHLAQQTIREPVPLGRPIGAGEAWRVAFNGFDWLADLVALGAPAAPVALAFLERWLAENQRWEALAWRPDVIGRRLSAWLAQPMLLAAGGDAALKLRLGEAVERQTRHLAYALPGGLAGQALLSGVKGLILGALALGHDGLLAAGLKQLARALPRQLLADGGHVERSPAVQLAVLRDLCDLRIALESAGRQGPSELVLAIERMAPVLRMFQAGDGGLALFNDSDEGPAGAVDLTLMRADAKAKALASAPQSGFHRLAAGPAVVLVDAGRPPPPGLDSHAHAGTLSFELYHGKERVIVNCGAQPAEGEWLLAQRSTAAHSTITVDDTNSSALMSDGHGLARPPSEVIVRREEAEGNLWLETSHDGYLPNYGLLHHRRLYLSADGADLRGHDRLEGGGGKRFTLRFHLHPSVNASLAQDKQAVLLRLPSGAGFRLRSQVLAAPGIAETSEVALGESIYLGRSGEPRRSQQVIVTGELMGAGAEIKWQLSRENRRK